jgi:hypothetical protein
MREKDRFASNCQIKGVRPVPSPPLQTRFLQPTDSRENWRSPLAVEEVMKEARLLSWRNRELPGKWRCCARGWCGAAAGPTCFIQTASERRQKKTGLSLFYNSV